MLKEKITQLEMEPVASSSSALMFQGVFQGLEKDIKITPDNCIGVYSFIQVACGQNVDAARVIWSRIKETHEQELATFWNSEQTFKFPGRGQKKTPVILFENVKDLLKLFIPGSRLPISTKRALFTYFGLNEVDMIRSYVEEEVHEKLLEALKMFNGIQQYSILNYRIDLYFPNHKVAVECDENGHSSYSVEDEQIRMKTITDHLGNEWVRYNPYEKNFCIFNLINQILIKLVK